MVWSNNVSLSHAVWRDRPEDEQATMLDTFRRVERWATTLESGGRFRRRLLNVEGGGAITVVYCASLKRVEALVREFWSGQPTTENQHPPNAKPRNATPQSLVQLVVDASGGSLNPADTLRRLIDHWADRTPMASPLAADRS